MKVLFLHCPKPDKVQKDAQRFQEWISVLDQIGICGKYYPLQSNSNLESIISGERPDIVFSADLFTLSNSGEKLNLHHLLDEMRIPYIGSTPAVSELVLSKSDLKEKWNSLNISTPSFFTFNIDKMSDFQYYARTRFNDYPYILKPNREGNSRGLGENSIVFNHNSMESKLREMLPNYNNVIVEKYLGMDPDLREFTIAMIGNGDNKLLMPAEIILTTKKRLRIVTTQDKDEHRTKAIPVIETEMRRRLNTFADKAFDVAGVRDYARCDVLLTGGKLYAIEINGQPMVPDKWFEVCASGSLLDSSQYLNAIIYAGIARNIHNGTFKLAIPQSMTQYLPTQVLNTLSKSIHLN